MFRRFRRRKPAPVLALVPAVEPAPAPVADLTGEQIFEQLHARLQRFIGIGGEWSLVRRGDGDTDAIFQAMVTHQIAAELTRGVLVERDLVAEPVGAEPIAMSWTPEPLVVWADPVDLAETETDAVSESDAASETEAETGPRPVTIAEAEPVAA